MKDETILCLWMKDATTFHPKANHSGNTFRCMTILFGACVPKTIFLVLRTFRNIQNSKNKNGFSPFRNNATQISTVQVTHAPTTNHHEKFRVDHG
jgi:hypothetical protein